MMMMMMTRRSIGDDDTDCYNVDDDEDAMGYISKVDLK
jgi:hypothetical protein